MWWIEFERRLNMAFCTVNTVERREMYSEPQKLHILLKKVKCEWLKNVSSMINIELSRTKLNYTYDEATTPFRNEVMKMLSGGSHPSMRSVKEVHMEE